MRRPSTLLAVTLPLGAVTAAAASLGTLTASGLATGNAPVAGCDSAFTVTYLAPASPPAGSTNPVDRVQVSDIATACEGGVLELVVVDTSGAVLARSTQDRTITAGDYSGGQGSVTVTLTSTIEASSIDPDDGTRLVIVGP